MLEHMTVSSSDSLPSSPVGNAKAKPLIGGLWSDSDGENGEEGKNLISLDEFFAKAKKPQIELDTRSDDSSGDKENIVTPDHNPWTIHGRLTSRSLVGGTFTISSPPEDDVSLSSTGTSLMGAGYLEGDQSVSTKQSNDMDYSDNEGYLKRADYESVSLLGDAPQYRSGYLLDHQDDAESSTSELSSVFTYGDDYFKRNPILPPSLFAKDNSENSPPPSEDEGESPDRGNYLRFPPDILSNMDSSDTDIYEDRTHDSSSVDAGLFEDEASSSVDGGQISPQISWTTYNQERGRELAQRLISQFRDPDDEDAPLSISSQELESPIPRRKLQFLQHPHNYLRRKQLQKDFQVVDATIKENRFQSMEPMHPPSDSESSYADSEHSSSSASSSGIRFPKLPSNDSLYEMAREGVLDDFDDKYQGDPFFEVWDTSFPSYLPAGLLPRKCTEEIASELKFATDACQTAIKNLGVLMATTAGTSKDGIPTIIIHDIEIPNYQAYVQQSVDKYRREVLQVSDGVYSAMLEEAEYNTNET